MTSLPESLSVVRPQWEAQLDAFHALSSRALDSAEQLFALNLKTSRASIEQVTGTWHQMLHAADPRDLFSLGTQAPWQQVFSYSRELLGIAMGARERNWSTIPVPAPMQPAPLLPAPIAQAAEQAGMAIAGATESNAALAEDTLGVGDQSPAADAGGAEAALQPAGQIEPAAASAAAAGAQADAPTGAPTELDAEKTGEAPSEVPDSEPQSEPDSDPVTEAPESAAPPPVSQAAALDEETSANVDALVDILIADEVPPAKAKPLVEALNELVPKPASVEHPIISTVPLENDGRIELPQVVPPESTPPVQASNGPAPERRRTSRKKS